MNRRNFLLASGLLSLAGCVETGTGYAPGEHPRIGPVQWSMGGTHNCLVLGSGGPRGFAHIGVLKALDEARLRPHLVVGSSAGAMVGVLWCAGYSGLEIEKIALDLGVSDIADFNLYAPTKMQGRGLQDFLHHRLIQRTRQGLIEELPHPFCAVAAPVEQKKLVAFCRGSAAAAVRASAALPSLFAPTWIDGEWYEDGDMVSPVPLRAAHALGAERVLAVDVSAFLEDTPQNARPSWITRDRERRAMIDAEVSPADVLMRVRLPYFASVTRTYRENVIGLGYEQAKARLAVFRQALS